MPVLEDYVNREQAYVKHIFLKSYLETLFHKTGSTYNHIVYVDGFAGPWQSADENFEDTSFGVALSALRKAKASLQQRGRNVKMTALLVEQNQAAYSRLAMVQSRFSEIAIKTYQADFRTIVTQLEQDIPADAFAFFLIDPKGWRIPLEQLGPLLSRKKSEIVFNFMFEFINRAASMNDPIVVKGLDELMPNSNWRQRLREAEEQSRRYGLSGDDRKNVLVGAFRDSLKHVGGYTYAAEITVLRPLKDRPLYCLVYGTRHESGITVFRDCQMAVLKAQAELRAQGKVKANAAKSGQSELFESMLDMAPDKEAAVRTQERERAIEMMRAITPQSPSSITYRQLWANVLSECAVRKTDLNAICANMKKTGELLFPDWEQGKKVPQDHYRMQRPALA